ncbi:MAG TPA: PPOX class F420-dependent oxidoreductase [Solirubrobacteraceae bacterium]|nr:PPOX class F420-dependent oxidoreductase [Solirubrobacteraceae bacterium]
MATLNDPGVRELLEAPNHAVVSTLNPDGSVLSVLAWIGLEDGELAVNSAVGRRWPSNLDRDGRITVLVHPPDNPYEYVEVRGTARGTEADADAHIDRLAKKYLGQDRYPFRAPGEVRRKYVITPTHIRHQRQG